jgi:signal transduction histidine kinase
MRPVFARLPFRSVAGQIVALILTVVLVFQAITIGVFTLMPRQLRPGATQLGTVERFIGFAQVLDKLPAAGRPDVLDAMIAASPSFNLTLLSPEQTHVMVSGRQASDLSPGARRPLLAQLGRLLGPEMKLFFLSEPSHPAGIAGVAVVLSDGASLTGAVTLASLGGPTPLGGIILTAGLIALMLIAFLWWAARTLTAPLARFAQAAENFTLDRNGKPLPEDDGADEIRVASRALNRMQMNIRKLIDSRTQMLAAVSHDLRTPITRMRLRVEFLEQGATRNQMVRDLNQMDRMVQGALAHLRNATTTKLNELIDLPSLLQQICDDATDSGGDVTYRGPARVFASANGDDLRRAVMNLVDNALMHGNGKATVELALLSETALAIDVIDEGPGIPDESKTAMLEPFARGAMAPGEPEEQSGFGLGLAIVASFAEAHGGKLLLLDTRPTGLTARLQIARDADGSANPTRAAAGGF